MELIDSWDKFRFIVFCDNKNVMDYRVLLNDYSHTKLVFEHNCATANMYTERINTVFLIEHNLQPLFEEKLTFSEKHQVPLVFINCPQDESSLSLEQPFVCIKSQPSFIELQYSIQLAIYKFSYQHKLNIQHSFLNEAVKCVGETLIYLDNKLNVVNVNSSANVFFGAQMSDILGSSISRFLSISRPSIAKQFEQFIQAAINTHAVTKIQPIAFNTISGEQVLFDGLIGPFDYQQNSELKHGAVLILRKMDELVNVPDELGLGANTIQKQSNTGVVLLINPDNFKQVNDKYGWQQGDLILQEIEYRLQKTLSSSDFSSRYSGAFFLVLLNDLSDVQTINAIHQIHNDLVKDSYLGEDVKLTFSVGFALNSPILDFSLLELFYFANTALSKSIELGGNQTQQWKQLTTLQQIGNFDRLHGGFLTKGSGNYRQMLTLWDLLNKIDTSCDFNRFVSQLNPILVSSLDLISISFYKLENQQIKWVHSIDEHQHIIPENQCDLTTQELTFISESSGKVDNLPRIEVIKGNDKLVVLLVLRVNHSSQVLLKFNRKSDVVSGLSNHHLLHKLSDFIRVNLQKIELNHVTQQVLDIDKSSKGKQCFWYSSKEMEALMHEVSMVADTDATVLITGESGTGKEFLAQQIHDLSNRRNKPFIIFDCSTIVVSLIESELFGHRKGAFTGADKNVDGCIKQAEGGTLFLDEIGELALETQMKLLRFIQEKQYSVVGTSSFNIADVRIISATNVDLLHKMEEGKFRQDLYYRLNVFNVMTPPLRKRQDDILLLANNYLATFAQKYNKSIIGFDIKAQMSLSQYQWPGNIRELKNIIHKAVILCNEKLVMCSHLGFFKESTSTTDTTSNIFIRENENLTVAATLASQSEEMNESDNCLTESHNWSFTSPLDAKVNQLLVSFSYQNISQCHGVFLVIERGLYNQALIKAGDITLQAAKILNVSESTFRRRWKILSKLNLNLSNQQQEDINAINVMIMALKIADPKPLTIRNILILHFVRLNLPTKTCAAMLDVSIATCRKLIKEVRTSQGLLQH